MVYKELHVQEDQFAHKNQELHCLKPDVCYGLESQEIRQLILGGKPSGRIASQVHGTCQQASFIPLSWMAFKKAIWLPCLGVTNGELTEVGCNTLGINIALYTGSQPSECSIMSHRV